MKDDAAAVVIATQFGTNLEKPCWWSLFVREYLGVALVPGDDEIVLPGEADKLLQLL